MLVLDGTPLPEADLTALYDRAYPEVATRLSPARLEHTLSVVATAEQLARAYDIDLPRARLAALLHDWDKDQTLPELLSSARRYDIEVPESPEKLLHAWTAARSAAEAFPDLPVDVAQAIERHTLAAPNMSDLDMLIYVADLIEPLRNHSDLEALRHQAGQKPLMLLFRDALQATFDYLESRQRSSHPLSLEAYTDINRRIQAAGLDDAANPDKAASPTEAAAPTANPDKPATSSPPPAQTGGSVKTSREIALLAAEAANDKKATDIIIQEVRQTLVICDYFVIATAANNRQVDAVCEAIEDKLRLEAGVKPIGREGLGELTWVLLDYGDVVVHVFQPELRDFYRLETLWSDSPIIDLAEAGILSPEYSERLLKLLQGQPEDEDDSSPTADQPGDENEPLPVAD